MKESVFKPVGTPVRLHAQIIVHGHVILLVGQVVKKDVHKDVQDVHHVQDNVKLKLLVIRVV